MQKYVKGALTGAAAQVAAAAATRAAKSCLTERRIVISTVGINDCNETEGKNR